MTTISDERPAQSLFRHLHSQQIHWGPIPYSTTSVVTIRDFRRPRVRWIPSPAAISAASGHFTSVPKSYRHAIVGQPLGTPEGPVVAKAPLAGNGGGDNDDDTYRHSGNTGQRRSLKVDHFTGQAAVIFPKMLSDSLIRGTTTVVGGCAALTTPAKISGRKSRSAESDRRGQRRERSADLADRVEPVRAGP